MSAHNRILQERRKARRAAMAEPKVNKFALFGETVLLGVTLFVLALPVVTAPAAYAAGAAHMERHLAGRPDTVLSLWSDFRAALPGSWKFGFGALAAGAIAAVNLLLAASGQLPGGTGVLIATAALAAGLAVLLLRTAVLWQIKRADAGRTAAGVWAGAWAQAKTEAVGDVAGTALLLAAMAMSVTFVWMLPPLVFIVPGVMVLAVVAVRYRTISK
ncbi:Poxvirus protein I5 [Specibacter sp. NPDC057265]|uniref:Poxvirus protein I5 n=1 Tax=Specibacter sp. NPDC057265 TaxID=3346075 RepID=UPI003628B69E